MDGHLRLQTWNCFGTAMDVKAVLRRRGPPDAHRLTHPVVHRELADADVLCMQEAWIPDAIELFESLDYPHKLRDDNPWQWWPFTIAGSGLALASRLPILWHEMRPFRTRGAGIDGLARKGMLLARVQWSGGELDIITVHLQASTGAAAERVRAAQLGELRAAVEEIGAADRPLMLAGDLNIDGSVSQREGEYARVQAELGMLEDIGAAGDLPTLCPRAELNTLAHRYWSEEPVQRLDYLLYRPARHGGPVVRQFGRLLDGPLPEHDSKPPTFASDHFGLRVELSIAGQHETGGCKVRPAMR